MLSEQSEDIGELMKAIFNIQHAVPIIERDSEGSTGKRVYKYSTLKKVWLSAKPQLGSEQVAIYQSPTTSQHGGTFFKTTLYHVPSKQFITEVMHMNVTKDDPQSIGSAITYYRRYMPLAMLGLVTDDDNDAADHQLATVDQKRKIVAAVRLYFPDVTAPKDTNQLINDIVGKNPSYIRADEADGVVEMIKAFATNSRDSQDEQQ